MMQVYIMNNSFCKGYDLLNASLVPLQAFKRTVLHHLVWFSEQYSHYHKEPFWQSKDFIWKTLNSLV